jgi:ATP-dependent Lhr-like helicase
VKTSVSFHPLVERWFGETFAAPTAVQEAGWREIAAGRDTLISAPTGSGKTLTAFLWAVNALVEAGAALEDRVHVVYVSPLKALGNDIQRNLQVPLAGISRLAEEEGTELAEIRVAVRSGDTPARERQLQLRHPPHILITTPESLYILLTAEGSRRLLRRAGAVIVDEIHAVAADKRGAHLALSLERLDALAGRPLQRIGLSATQKPIEEVARLLIGAGRLRADGSPRCAIVDAGHRRELDLRIETPDQELGPIASHEMRGEIYDRIAELIRAHRTTIVFVNTRRLVERVAHALGERLGKEKVAAHHGSLSRETRLAAEAGLKSGAVPAVVATASLELGIDVGHVDLVCHLGAPRALATLLQRVGRSGHSLGAIPKGILFPLTRDELLQSAAAVRAVRAGELDRLHVSESPLDILAQQIVAAVASAEMGVEELWALVRRAYPFRRLPRRDFDAVLAMLADGVNTRRGRRSAHLHLDRVHARVRPRRGARLAAITGGGAIPDTADYDVIEEPAGTLVGKVNEDFAVESLAGDTFLLGNRSWRIRRVEAGRIRVVDAEGAPPTIPFWLGEAPARTLELSRAVADLRGEAAGRIRGDLPGSQRHGPTYPVVPAKAGTQPDLDPRVRGDDGTLVRGGPQVPVHEQGAVSWLMAETCVDRGGAEQIVRYVGDTVAMLGTVPTLDTIVAERFFDEAGGMQLVLHTPFGGRINRALGLALRKRFCVRFDFELQAAATDDGVVLSLGEQHSFPLDGVFGMLHPERFEKDLVQAALVAPMFTNRWRWNATRALALRRFSGGRKVPMPLQRMRAEDLLAAVFPAQLSCGDNHTGPIEPPDHPLVGETLDNCLHEAMDADGLRAVLEGIESGAIRTVAVETPAPSPMSHEILNANPYAFLDDAPLEERRARAVSLRRVEPDLAAGIGALDPQAIAEVREQAWPEARDADEVHDVLLGLGVLPEAEAWPWREHLEALLADGRAVRLESPAEGRSWHAAAERAELARRAFPGLRVHAARMLVPQVGAEEDADGPIVRGWMEAVGPTTAEALAGRLGIPAARVEAALLLLESQGVVLRGHYTADAAGEDGEWCERGLLARIHRLTLGRLRSEIEAVSAADFMCFLFRWQHLAPGTQLHGRDGVRRVIAQLQGLELPGPAWERDVLPARIAKYDPEDLEHLCLAGEVAWGRLSVRCAPAEEEDASPPLARHRRQTPTRSAPLAFFLRADMSDLLAARPGAEPLLEELSPIARQVWEHLERRGASFLADIAREIHRLPSETEEALWELVASGLVTGDGVVGLRTLLLPEKERRPRRSARHLRSLPGRAARRLMPVGRWSLLRGAVRNTKPEAQAEAAARRLLDRYGVVFRDLSARERHMPAWRSVLSALRRMEARGEVRGGRFVAGFVGEQFALPEAVDALRAVRRLKGGPREVLLAAADPLNLVGIITPGARVPPYSGQVIVYRDGVPAEVGELGAVLSKLGRGRVS